MQPDFLLAFRQRKGLCLSAEGRHVG
jgi:hypothetical protein